MVRDLGAEVFRLNGRTRLVPRNMEHLGDCSYVDGTKRCVIFMRDLAREFDDNAIDGDA